MDGRNVVQGLLLERRRGYLSSNEPLDDDDDARHVCFRHNHRFRFIFVVGVVLVASSSSLPLVLVIVLILVVAIFLATFVIFCKTTMSNGGG